MPHADFGLRMVKCFNRALPEPQKKYAMRDWRDEKKAVGILFGKAFIRYKKQR